MSKEINATHTGTEQIWQDEQTRYWFHVTGELYGVNVEGDYCWCDENGGVSILDGDGAPLTDGDGETETIRKVLAPHVERLQRDPTA